MNVAVLTLTRDRLDYTQHCFQTLWDNAGCEYDHFVLDQGSDDGTVEWLGEEAEAHERFSYASLYDNVGISKGMQLLLGLIAFAGNPYDVIVKFDNDCELLQPNTLRDVCALAYVGDAILSPRILGLRRPPAPCGEFHIGVERIIDIPQIGGIFQAIPARLFQRFSYDTSNDDDDVQLCWWYRAHGGRCGYVDRLSANHYETTDGQWQRYPEYFERRVAEGGRAF